MILKNPQAESQASLFDCAKESAVGVECTHCHLPVPAGLIKWSNDQLATEQFCCNGCRCAYALIRRSGLGGFYGMLDASGNRASAQVRTRKVDFAQFDEVCFHEKFVSVEAGQIPRVTLALPGIHCAACVWLLEKLPVIQLGVSSARVDWAKQTITVVWQPEKVALSEIAKTLHRLGYTPSPASQNAASEVRDEENRRQLIRIGVAAAAAGNNMIIAAALYFGMFSAMSAPIENLLRWASCIIGVASYLGPGRVFLKSAWTALVSGTPHMDLPIALGLTAGTITGLVNVFRGDGDIYFDSLSVLISVLLIGRWVQFRQQNKAANAVDMLYRLTPSRARRLDERGNVESVDAECLKVGDRITIFPGDLIPADAMIIEGETLVDESILTGESVHVRRGLNEKIFAGTKNVRSKVDAVVDVAGNKTRIHSVVELVQNAFTEKTEIVQLANRIGGRFVIAVMALALLTFLYWCWYDVSYAVDRAVALTIVACPCALAMATPLAIAVGLGALARRKILVKAGDVLQSLGRPGMIWLDKTGTLTEGRMQVTQWHGDPNDAAIVAAIEATFSHPIADAVEAYVAKQNEEIVKEVKVIKAAQHDGGLRAEVVVGDDRRRQCYLVGNRRFLESSGIVIEESWSLQEADANQRQMSVCWVAKDSNVVSLFELGDKIRADSVSFVRQLKLEGWTVGVLSGDQENIVQTVAEKVSADVFHAGVSPEEKLEVIRDSNERFDTTVMVGDGVNDGAALAAATVGIAVKNGAEASLAAAPVFLAKEGLVPICELLQSSRCVNKTIRNNFIVSIAYNVLGASLAIFGFINPLVAAILMPISSLTVITMSLTAATVNERLDENMSFGGGART